MSAKPQHATHLGFLEADYICTEQPQWGLCALRHGIQTSMEAIWLATQRDPQNDWTATQNRVNYDVFAQTPLCGQNEFVRSFSLLRILSLALTSLLFSPVHLN